MAELRDRQNWIEKENFNKNGVLSVQNLLRMGFWMRKIHLGWIIRLAKSIWIELGGRQNLVIGYDKSTQNVTINMKNHLGRYFWLTNSRITGL